MRTPDQDELPGDGESSQPIGEGFGGVSPEQLPTYGDDFYDEYDDTYEDESTSSDEAEDTSVVEDDEISTDGDMTEDQAEDILEDVLEDTYGEEADEIAQELQEDTGMSAIEILEDLTGLDLDGSDESSYASDFDRQMAEAAEADAASDTTATSDLFNEDMPSESDFDLNTDGHVDRHDVDEAAEGLGFSVGD